MKAFVEGYLGHGEVKKVAHIAGLHANSVYAWIKGRNQPSPLSLIWFLRALSQYKNLSYEFLWIEYIYTLEGDKNAKESAREWVKNSLALPPSV